MAQLSRLIYSSVRKPNCTDKEINNILESCRKNNPSLNITGVLLHSRDRFMQYLEGESGQIIKLYDHIKLDNRHKNVIMLGYSPISGRIFPSWHMGYKDVDTLSVQTEISSEDQQVFESLISGQQVQHDHGVEVLQKFFASS